MGIKVVYLDMPCRVKGFVLGNDDGTHTIFINAKLNFEQQVKVYNHELQHIKHNDIERDDVDALELVRHGI
ncbi:MAG: hypothetical protein K0S04_295 [Herbinix sp.]|nr:hypothetical protein [Herbinix sp.]